MFHREASEGSPTPEVTEEQNTPRKALRNSNMKTSFVLIAAACFVAAANAQEFEELVATVNSNPKSSWKAVVPTRFNSTEDVKTLCGTWLKGSSKVHASTREKIR